MKNLIELPAIAFAMAMSPLWGATALVNTYDFVAGVTPDTNNVGDNWYVAGGTIDTVGKVTSDGYFAVDSGDAVIYRTALPLTTNQEEKIRVQSYGITNETLYLETQVRFALSIPPTGNAGGDKLLVWLDEGSNICVTAGRYAKSFGASGVTNCHYQAYTNGVPLKADEAAWHTLGIKAYRALSLDIFNSAFELYFDGQPLELAPGADIVEARLAPLLDSYLGDDGKTAYHAGRLFPALIAGHLDDGIVGIGASGYGGGIDKLVITNGVPTTIDYADFKRYLVLTCEPGLTQLVYSVTNNYDSSLFASGTIPLAGKLAEVAIPISTNGNTVVIDDFAIDTDKGYQSVYCGSTQVTKGFALVLAAGFNIEKSALAVTRSSGFEACRVKDMAGTTITNASTIAEAIAVVKAQALTNATLTLLHDCDERVEFDQPFAVTLDLSNYTLRGPDDDEGYSALTVAPGASLTILAGTGGTVVTEDASAFAVEANGLATLAIAGGSYPTRVDVAKDADLTVSGGTFYANNKNNTFEFADAVAAGHQAVWNGDDSSWTVAIAPSLVAASAPKLAKAGAALGLSKADIDTMVLAGSAPKIYITGIVTEPSSTGALITCQVRVVLNDQGVDASGFLLQQLVQVSRDLVNWAPADVIEYSEVDANGECTVTITVNDGDGDANYFVRLYDAE